MKEGSPKQQRGCSLGTKLSEAKRAVAAATEKSAFPRGQPLRQWYRKVVLEAAAGPTGT